MGVGCEKDERRIKLQRPTKGEGRPAGEEQPESSKTTCASKLFLITVNVTMRAHYFYFLFLIQARKELFIDD